MVRKYTKTGQYSKSAMHMLATYVPIAPYGTFLLAVKVFFFLSRGPFGTHCQVKFKV